MAKTTKTTTATDSAPHPDHAGGSVTTTDHEAIKAWAEARGGKPAAADGTEQGPDDVGLIRLEFPGATNANDSKLHEITWDEFFAKFDEGGLALLYQEQTAAGEMSMFNRFLKRETAEAKASAKKGTAKKGTAKKATAKKAAPAAKAVGKKTAAKKTVAKTTARKAPPAAKKSAAKKAPAAKKSAAKKAPAAKKAAAKKVPPARGYRGR